MKNNKRKLVSIADFCEKRKVSKSNIYRWISYGYIDIHKVNGATFLDESELSELPSVPKGRPFSREVLKRAKIA